MTAPDASGASAAPATGASAAPASGASTLNAANAVTAFRLALVPLFGWLLLHQQGDEAAWRFAAFLAFATASITDRFDGELARRRGLVTDVGTIADPIADKALIGMALVGLSVLHELAWWVTGLVMVREIGITVLRLVVIRHGVMPASRGGKVKTLLQALAIGLFLLPPTWLPHAVAEVVMAVAVVVTVVTGVDYVVRAVRLRRTSPRALAKLARRQRGA